MLDTFQLCASAYRGDRRAIACDGLVPGAALDLSHWPGNRTPAALKADTSTEIALGFPQGGPGGHGPRAAEWADAIVVNNHFDADGVLSVFALLAPATAQKHRGLMVAAAEAGDFDEWPADHRGLWLEVAIRKLAEPAGDDEAEAYRTILPALPALLEGIEGQGELWREEWETLEGAQALVRDRHVEVAAVDRIAVVRHGSGVPELPGPALFRALSVGPAGAPASGAGGAWPDGLCRILLAFAQPGGAWSYRYELPRHAWADTVRRPKLSRPDGAALARGLGAPWTAEGLAGMTGVVRTAEPVRIAPEAVHAVLASLDR